MNVKKTCNCPIIFLILIGIAFVFVAFYGYNIGLRRDRPDVIQLREEQRAAEATIGELSTELELQRDRSERLAQLTREANSIVSDITAANAADNTDIARARQILQRAIEAVYALEILYNWNWHLWDNRLDIVFNEVE